ncbi:MAG: Transcriptional activator TraM [Bryobacterales bacterium]|nr:Transcriptional activator TraM [Bryobacterales bacterium]
MKVDVQSLIGEIAARNGVRVDHDDPIFAVSTINRLMLDDAIETLIERVRVVIGEFEASAHLVDNRAGKVLADEVRKSAAAWKTEIAKDVAAASLRSNELIKAVHLAHSRPAVVRWAALGMFVGLILFGCGVWVGTFIR